MYVPTTDSIMGTVVEPLRRLHSSRRTLKIDRNAEAFALPRINLNQPSHLGKLCTPLREMHTKARVFKKLPTIS